jgi:hypothetical protein
MSQPGDSGADIPEMSLAILTFFCLVVKGTV